MKTVCWAYYMDILNCFRYVKQPHNFIQPLVRLRTCWPWWSLLDADQEVLGGVCWEVQLWSSVLGTANLGTALGAVPESTGSQNGAGMMPFLIIPGQLCPAATGALAQGKGAVGNAAQAAVPGVCWVVIRAWPCKNIAVLPLECFPRWFSRLSETPSFQIWCGQLHLSWSGKVSVCCAGLF